MPSLVLRVDRAEWRNPADLDGFVIVGR